jgi:hypothetical protein
MRSLLLLAAAALGACATAPAATPVHGVTPGHKGETDGTAQFIGQAGTSETGAAIMRASHAAVLRWAPPGYALTMDYSESRVTVYLDAANRVTEIKCG